MKSSENEKSEAKLAENNDNSAFGKDTKAKSRHSVNIRPDVYREIKNIVYLHGLLNTDVSVSWYINNVLIRYLKDCEEHIADLRRRVSEL